MLRRFLSMAALAGTLLFSAVGCNLGFSEDAAPDQQHNACSDSDECRGGVCLGGICRAQSTDLGALLLHVTPPSGTPMIAGVGFTSVVEELAFEPGRPGYKISLGKVSKLAGTVAGEEISTKNCVRDASMPTAKEVKDGSIAARLTLIPRARLWGLTVPSYTIDVTDTASDSYRLELYVPPGRYDVYVQPQATSDGCVHPPYLALDRELKPGTVDLDVNLPEPTALPVRVVGSGLDLRDWTIEIVERDSGRRLSNRAPIEQVGESLDEYTALVAYSQVEGSEDRPASELVLLAPPKDVIAPSVYVERSVVELFQDGDGLIDQLTTLPRPVTFSARVGKGNSLDPVSANVLLLATRLASTGPGTVAAFSRSVKTDDKTGLFNAQILPGTYRVVVQPLDDELRPIETEITVSDAEVQAGRTILIEPRNEVTGRLVDFNGQPIAGVPVALRAMDQGMVPSVLELAQGQQLFLPTATSDSTDKTGSFDLKADQGSFQLSLHPPEDSGYPWYVKLAQEVSADSLSLGKLSLSLPVAVSGVLTSDDVGEVSNARIVVYAMLKDGQVVAREADATQIVPVAESRSDEKGQFRLLLPSKVN